MKLTPFGVILVVVVIALLGFGGYMLFKGNSADSNQQSSSPAPVNTQVASKPTKPSVAPQQPEKQTSANPPTDPQAVGDDTYPVLVCDGSKPQLNVAMDQYAGFYPVVLRIIDMPASDQYCINFIPKWFGDKNNFEEYQVEQMLRAGDIDIYFASNGALALYDANSGLAIWTTDQSRGADVINARNNISSTQKPTFNDVLGRTILTSKGSADHFFVLKMLQTTGFTPDLVNLEFPGSPVDEFVAGKGDLVSYWDPAIRRTYLPNTTILVTTKYWPTISDYVVISHKADSEKSKAVQYFLSDIISATEGFTKANIAETANKLANFKFEGQNMADWLMIDKDDPYNSLNSLLEGVAIATLNDNVTMFETDPTGSNLVIDQQIKAHNTWLFGQVYDNGNKGSLFNPNILVSDKYVKIMLESGAKQVSGSFNNKYDTDVSKTPPPVDSNTLIKLPELLTLPYQNIKFVENYSNLLVEGEEQHLLDLVQPIANLMAESDDSTIVIRGGSGNFTTDPTEKLATTRFAFKRSQFIKSLLSDQLGIPIQRIILDPNVLLPDHAIKDQAELEKYMVVIIKVVNAGNFK